MESQSVKLDAALRAASGNVLSSQKQQLARATDRELKHLSFLSHDMNNNLAAVSLHLGVLRRGLGTGSDFADAREMLERAQESIDHTVRGTRRLLEYSELRATPKRETTRRTNLWRLATSVVAQQSVQAAAKGVNLSVDVPPDAVVAGDEDLLVLVLQNLVGNGLKHSDRGTVRVGFQETRNCREDHWVLSVSDEGRGIPAEHLPEIFTAYRRVGASSENGVGLGLAIAAEAARLLGAELSVASTLGVGSTFELKSSPNTVQQKIRDEAFMGEWSPLFSERNSPWHCQYV